MRIGPLHVTWMTSKLEQMISATLTGLFGRGLIAKIARGEVKNYLAELAEQSERPFVNPSFFLAKVRTDLAQIDAANWVPEPLEHGVAEPLRVVDKRLAESPRHALGQEPLFCNATPAGSNWPVCSKKPHLPGTEHSSGDFAWRDGGRVIPILTDEAF
jgi:hypothetical protein